MIAALAKVGVVAIALALLAALALSWELLHPLAAVVVTVLTFPVFAALYAAWRTGWDE